MGWKTAKMMISTLQKRHQGSVMMRAIWWAAAGLGAQSAVSHHAEQFSCHLPFAQWPAGELSRSGDSLWHLSLLVFCLSLAGGFRGDGSPSAGWTAGASRCFQESEAYSFCYCFKIKCSSGFCHWAFKKENVTIDFIWMAVFFIVLQFI